MGDVFLKILNMSIIAGWLILAILCVRFLFRKMPKWVSCLLWGIVAVRLIFPFSIESELSVLPSAEPIRSSTIVGGEIIPYVPSVDSTFAVVENTVNPILSETFAYQETESVAPLQVFTGIAGSIWLCGMVILLVFALGSMVRLSLLVRESVRYKGNVYLCDAVKSPFILGIIRPRIYLPSSLNEAEMEYIIAHEKAHLKRKDHLWKPFGYLILCVYWFNPLCWLAYILLCKDIELACDEKVIKDISFVSKKEYSRVLLACATQRHLVFACPLAFGEVGVKERVKSVLHYKKPALWISISAMLICGIIAVCFLTNPSREYQIRITIPAGSIEMFCYSDEEICPKGNTLTLANGEGLGDTEVVLLPVEVKEENAYEPMYMTPGMPVKMDVEKGAWFKIGINMQNPTAEDKDVYVTVQNVEIRIASREEDNELSIEETDVKQEIHTEDHTDELAENAFVQDLTYYMELAAGTEFQEMNPERQAHILGEYKNLLDDYTLIARESIDGRAAYIVGYSDAASTQNALSGMYGIELSAGEEEVFQFLYGEEDAETVNAIMAKNKTDFPDSVGYRIENSRILWPANGESLLIQPKDVELLMDVPYTRILYIPNGREYIADAVNRGIDICGQTDTYLYVYRMSEQFGEIAERIALTEAEAKAISEEKLVAIPEGYGFAATLHRNGTSDYYGEHSGVPQTILDLAIEKCEYRFENPGMIQDTILEARLDCDWLDHPIYAKIVDIPRLQEILKNAEFGYVGGCGYGAKLSLTFPDGEKMTVFKGCDDCDTIVFGSYSGYFLGDKENTEFWEIFGLDPKNKLPIEIAPQESK